MVAKFADKVFFAIISYQIVFTLPPPLQMYRNVARNFEAGVGISSVKKVKCWDPENIFIFIPQDV